MIRSALLWLTLIQLGAADDSGNPVDLLLHQQLESLQSLQHGRVVLHVREAKGMSIADAIAKGADVKTLSNTRYEVVFDQNSFRARSEPLDHQYEEIRIGTPDYVINVRPDHCEILSHKVASVVDIAGIFDPRLLQVSSNSTRILYRSTLGDAILFNDRRNEQVEAAVIRGIPVQHVSFDRVIGNRFDRWIAPDQGFAVLESRIVSKPFEGPGPYNGKSSVGVVARTMEEYHPGIWFPKTVHRRSEIDGQLFGEELVEIESADFQTVPDADLFTLAGVGLKPGDEVHRDGHPLLWNGDDLIEPNPPRETGPIQIPAVPPETVSLRRWMLLLNALILAIVATVIAIRRHRKVSTVSDPQSTSPKHSGDDS